MRQTLGYAIIGSGIMWFVILTGTFISLIWKQRNNPSTKSRIYNCIRTTFSMLVVIAVAILIGWATMRLLNMFM